MASFKFDTFGVMIDMSRNAVMSMEGLKSFLLLLKKMGYNCAMLYTEDTYEVDGEPYFGYLRGRYTKEELKELNAFSNSLGITLIPCIQALAHLNANVRWGKLPIDVGDILLIDDERTYELIDHMFSSLAECFTARKIHVGMDEAHMVGRGRYLDEHGYEKTDVLMKRHLARVCEIAEKYGFELMIWSDMLFRPWNGGMYYAKKTTVPKEYVDALPKSVIPVYWDYYKIDEQSYGDMFENHLQFSKKFWFAGGSWSWGGFAPFNEFTLSVMKPAIDACRKHRIKNMVMTMWGDNGAECSHFAQIPSLYYLAQYAKGITDESVIKASFEKRFGIPFDDFMKLDLPNSVNEKLRRIPSASGELNVEYPTNPCKYMLYSDCFNGYLDYTVKEGCSAVYPGYAEELRQIAKKSRRYGYLFDAAAKLCDVLAIKYELGVKTRKAYKAGDKAALKKLAENEYAEVIKRVRLFAKAFEKQWFKENKTSGFDVQDIRLGGLIYRLDACRRRLLDYACGKIDRIEELEADILPYGTKEETSFVSNYALNATGNIL